jgi:hypothetical protein
MKLQGDTKGTSNAVFEACIASKKQSSAIKHELRLKLRD